MLGLYARVSTDEQNVQQQKDLLKEYCNKNNLAYRSYIDFAMSGEINERKAWTKLINDIDKGFIKGIIVVRYDRITRNLAYAIQFLDWLQKANITLYSLYDGEFMFKPNDVFMFKMKVLLSEYELEQTRYRSKIGIDRAKKEGKFKGRLPGSKNKDNPNYKPLRDIRD